MPYSAPTPSSLQSASSVRAISQVEGEKVLGVHAEWETTASGRQKMATIQVAALHGTPFLFHLRRVPSRFTKETFPTALEGLLVDPNIMGVSVANHGCRDKKHEYITCVPLFLVGIYCRCTRARWRCRVNTDV